MSQESLADQAVHAIAEVRAIGENVSNEHPMRHSVRSLKHTAEDILTAACRQAAHLAYQAQVLVKDYDESTKEKS